MSKDKVQPNTRDVVEELVEHLWLTSIALSRATRIRQQLKKGNTP